MLLFRENRNPGWGCQSVWLYAYCMEKISRLWSEHFVYIGLCRGQLEPASAWRWTLSGRSQGLCNYVAGQCEYPLIDCLDYVHNAAEIPSKNWFWSNCSSHSLTTTIHHLLPSVAAVLFMHVVSARPSISRSHKLLLSAKINPQRGKQGFKSAAINNHYFLSERYCLLDERSPSGLPSPLCHSTTNNHWHQPALFHLRRTPRGLGQPWQTQIADGRLHADGLSKPCVGCPVE
jgi:hypothetical protein